MDLSAFNLQGKVALITGGAHGIGFSIAEGMAKCGAAICFNCSSEASLEKGLAAYKAAGIDAHGYVADVSDEDAVNAMVAKIKAEVGPVDILVNNAGLMKRVPMIEMSHADFMRVIDVHVGGAFNCSKAVLPDMMEKREGKIINICSMMSELGRETVSAYAAAKGAILGLTREWAAALVHDSVRVNAIVVAEAWTPLYANWIKTFGDEEAQQKRLSLITDRIPLEHRMTSTEEIADTTCFLLSDRSSHTTGQWCNVDGGYVNLDRALD